MLKRLTALLILTAVPALAEPLPRDEGNVYGRFDNGVNYVLRHNANPPGRVNMYLHVKTGALNESGDQNGLAHFLEHMAFNGSTHFPPGKLLPLLGSLGMTFGADTNAHTNYWETLYKLNLPNTEPKTVELGSKILADYAAGLTLSDDEIESERKIILEEYRSRQGVGQRIWKQTARDVFAGTKLATHDVIGDVEQIKTFPAAAFRQYYDKWYRPENMTLIVVGDIKADDVLATAKPWLGAVTARTPAAPSTKAGLTPSTQPRAFVYTDAEQVNGSIDFTTLATGEPPMTTYEQLRKELLRGLATGIVNRRLGNLVATGKAPFRTAAADIDTFLNEAVTAGAQATGEPQDWKAMLTATIAEVDRVVEHGFDDAELKLIERGMLASFEQAVVAEATRDSTSVINSIASDIGRERPILSASQELALLKRVLADVKATDVAAAFSGLFSTNDFDYVITLPGGKPDVPAAADVLAVASAAWSAKTEPIGGSSVAADLLAAEPKAGEIVGQQTDADLKISTATFANGVVMHHKFSDYKKDTVLVNILLPGGQLEEAAETRGVSELAGALLDRPATTRLNSTQIKDLLTGKNLSLDGGIGRDAMTISVQANNQDLPTALQLAHALLTDGQIEQAAVDDWKKQQLQAITKEEKEPRGQLQKALARTFYGDDPRFRPLTRANVQSLSRDTAQAWFERIAGGSAVEVTVIGDISLEAATRLVSTYFGSLPSRQRGFDALDALRKIERPAGPYAADVTFASVTPQALALAGFISSDENSLDRRPLAVAAEVLSNRMIDRIREKEQLVYSIGASNRPSRGLPGTGLMTAGSLTDPANGAKLADTVVEMMNEFAKTGPTDDELATAKKQIMTEVTTTMRDPAWWMTQLSELSYRKRPLADLKNLPGVFDTFSKEDVRGVVAKYLRPETTVRYVITPNAASPATQPAAPARPVTP